MGSYNRDPYAGLSEAIRSACALYNVITLIVPLIMPINLAKLYTAVLWISKGFTSRFPFQSNCSARVRSLYSSTELNNLISPNTVFKGSD